MLKSIFWGQFSCFLGPVCSPGTPASMLGTGVPLRDRAGWISPMFSHTEGRFAAPTPRTGLCRGVWDLFSLFFFFFPPVVLQAGGSNSNAGAASNAGGAAAEHRFCALRGCGDPRTDRQTDRPLAPTRGAGISLGLPPRAAPTCCIALEVAKNG